MMSMLGLYARVPDQVSCDETQLCIDGQFFVVQFLRHRHFFAETNQMSDITLGRDYKCTVRRPVQV